MELNQVLALLSEVAARLSDLPEDAFDERLRLRERQNELRALSAELLAKSGDPQSAEEARRQIAWLESERDRYLDTRLGHSAGAQTGQGGGIDPKFVHDMHAAMDKAFHLDELNAGIGRLRRHLERLEGAQPR